MCFRYFTVFSKPVGLRLPFTKYVLISYFCVCVMYRFNFLKCNLFWRNVYRAVCHSPCQKFVTPCRSSRRGKKGLTFFVFTVLDQSFSEISFHFMSIVQSSRFCRVSVWKVYFAAIDVKFCDEGI